MFELLENFQQTASHFPARALVVPGIILLLGGLFVWLGGLRWRKIITAFIAALSAGLATMFAAVESLIWAPLAAGAAAIVGAFLERVVISILAIALAAIITIAVFTWPVINADIGAPAEPLDTQQMMTLGEAIETMADYGGSVIEKTRVGFKSANGIALGAAAGAGFVVFLMMIGSPKLPTAIFCSIVGSSMVFCGMVLLLFYKRAAPVTIITQKPMYFAAAFAAMVVFGVAAQLLLYPPKRKKVESKTEESDGEKK